MKDLEIKIALNNETHYYLTRSIKPFRQKDWYNTCKSMIAYSNNAPKTKNMQQITQDCIAFNPSAFGEFVVVVLKIFT